MSDERIFWLVIGISGEYSDRTEWPVALYETEEEARLVAESAKRHAAEQQAIHDAWHRDVYAPWYNRTRPVFGPGAPDYPDLPIAPPRETNPFDPDNGLGDDYTVEIVPLRRQP